MRKMQWVNTVSLVVMLLVNGLSNLLSLGGGTTGQVSARYASLFTPAPVTFAIWGVIYALLTIFVIYQWTDMGNELREAIGPWFAVSCALNSLWIVVWHFDQISLSLILIVLLLAVLFLIQMKLRGINGSFLHKLITRGGFDLYYGWIIAATIANLSVLMTKIGWNVLGFSDQFWTMTMLVVGTAITAVVVLTSNTVLPGASVIWAYSGIILRHAMNLGGSYPVIIIAATVSILVILCLMVLRFTDYGVVTDT